MTRNRHSSEDRSPVADGEVDHLAICFDRYSSLWHYAERDGNPP